MSQWMIFEGLYEGAEWGLWGTYVATPSSRNTDKHRRSGRLWGGVGVKHKFCRHSANSSALHEKTTFSRYFFWFCWKYQKYFCIFATCFERDTRHIGTTKRYARLANGNVGNFQRCARTVITVRAIAWTGYCIYITRAILTASIRRRGKSAPRFISI